MPCGNLNLFFAVYPNPPPQGSTGEGEDRKCPFKYL